MLQVILVPHSTPIRTLAQGGHCSRARCAPAPSPRFVDEPLGREGHRWTGNRAKPTLRLAEYPTAYGVTVAPEAPFLIVPQVSSERREYVPIGWLEPPVIPSEKLRLLRNATLADFALLTSTMHMAWMRAVTGRMKSDYMYSVAVVYNTFPQPPEGADLAKVGQLARKVLDARIAHPSATLADLYDPDSMPLDLRRAHRALDHAVDRLYRRGGFSSERERIEHLFMLYERMQAPLHTSTARKRS